MRALGSATRSLNLAANEVFATASDRWRRWGIQARHLRSEVSRLFPSEDERPQELHDAFDEHARALAQAEADIPGCIEQPGSDHLRDS